MNEQEASPHGLAWMRWTFFEALARTSSAVFQKVVGNMTHVADSMLLSVSLTAYGAGIIGVVQVLWGTFQCGRLKISIFTTKKNIIGSLAFGVLAYIATVLSFMAFVLGADLGARTFIVTLAIIPGSLVGLIFFKKKLTLLQITGMAIGIYAGYVILDSPQVTGTSEGIPLWVWLAIANAVAVGLNQGVTEWIKDVDGHVKNFWGGMVAIPLGIVTVLWLGKEMEVVRYERIWDLTGVSIVLGCVVVVLWLMNLFAYKDGSFVAFKMLFMNGTYLALSMLAGALIFNEPFTSGKVIGVFLFAVSFAFMNEKTWGAIQSFWVTHQLRP